MNLLWKDRAIYGELLHKRTRLSKPEWAYLVVVLNRFSRRVID